MADVYGRWKCLMEGAILAGERGVKDVIEALTKS